MKLTYTDAVKFLKKVANKKVIHPIPTPKINTAIEMIIAGIPKELEQEVTQDEFLNYMQIKNLSKEEQIALYMKSTKKELAEMLYTANLAIQKTPLKIISPDPIECE